MKLLAVVFSPAPSWARRFLLPLSPGVLVLCLACVTTPPPETAPAPAGQLLDEGRPVERTLGGGDRHEHRLAVEAGWYVRLEVEQIGVDVAASLLGPDGATLFSTDDPDGLQDREVLAVIAPAAGELRLVVAPRDPQATPGAYRVALAARRPAGPGDAARAAAQKAVSEAWRELALGEEQGKQEAISRLEEAVRLWGVAGEIREQIDLLNEIGTLQNSVADTEAALATLRRALSLSQQIGDGRWQAHSHTNLAAVFLALADYSQTLDQYQQALPLWIHLGDIREQGRVLYGIGLIHRERGDFDGALPYLTQALPLRRAAGDVLETLKTLVALAGVHQGRGNTTETFDCLNQALELSRSTGGQGEEYMLTTLAQFHRYRGELGDALSILRKARDLYQRNGNESLEARALHQLGAVYLELGDQDQARSSFEQGLALIAGKSPEGEARFLNSLGWTLYLRNDPQAALGYFEKALAVSREKNLPAALAQTLGYTGAVYVSIGRAGEGLKLLQEEIALRRANGDRLAEAKSLLEIGGAWQALGDPGQASANFRAALDLGRRVGNTGLQATCLYRWALLDSQRGELRQALERIEGAIQIIESVRSQVSSEKLRTTYLASKRAWYELYVDLLMRLEELEPGQGHAAAALEASERARARGLLDLIAEGNIDVQEGIAPELKRKETDLGARLSWIQEQLGEMLAKGLESDRTASLTAQLDQVGEEMERLEEEVRRWHPRYAEVRYPTPLRLEQIEGLLDESSALLEYFVGREASFLFLVTRNGLSAHRLPAADVLESKAQALRRTLERPGILTLGQFRMAAGDLYDVLLGPVAHELARTPSLLISPDGPLSLIPFEALLADPARGSSYDGLAYLIREHSISYVPSASVLDGLRELGSDPLADAPAPKRLIAFGDPIYPSAQVAEAPVRDAVSPWTAPELPGSGREVSAIAHLYPESDVELYLRERATEENVKANPLIQTAQRIHFATHGFVDEARPQLSGLMLTRDPASEQNGLLQVYEIFNLRLNAELVALSACDTALGERVTGEGMVGLTRAFHYAGARSLLVSLWPVSDRSTPDLMTAFYRSLGEEGKSAALRRAKLERIQSGDEPYRWAPFILSGDPH